MLFIRVIYYYPDSFIPYLTKIMKKIYLTADRLLNDSFKLANIIYQSGFKPHFIIAIWRGGTPVGIAVQEFFEYKGISTDHIAIRTSSYTDINQQAKTVKVHGLQYVLNNIEADHQLLLVDDVFDTGRSIRATLEKLKLRARRNTPKTIRIATPWFKPNRNVTDMKPDYFLHETDDWIVFPHEIQGLTPKEIIDNKPDIASSLFTEVNDK